MIPMKKIIALLMTVFCLNFAHAHADEAVDEVAYISGFEDLPLMDGMVEREDLNIVFDTVEGRIVQSFAETEDSYENVMKFYKETLESLGWVESGKDTFSRDDGVLTIEVVEESPLVIKFELK